MPARNEERYLPRLLPTVEEAARRYAGGSESVERILVDNASTDATAAVGANAGWRVVREEKRVIAAVRNTGARAASGEVLAFVDADSRIHPDTFDAVAAALASGRVVAGATGVRLDRLSPGIALTYALFLPMVWATRMDTGVVFCRRDDFLAVGGYDETLRFGEDVRLLLDLRRLGRARGQRLARVTCAKAIASTRKFDRFGDWHYFGIVARGGFWLLASPRRAHRFVTRYWYEDAR